MTTYWKYQRTFDILISALVTALLLKMGRMSFTVFEFDAEHAKSVASDWLGAVLSLFGLVSATVAFVFSAIDSTEFKILRESKSKRQLWDIFSFTLIILLIACFWCTAMTLFSNNVISSYVVFITTPFVIITTSLLLAKFTWVMTQIIAVKAC